MFRAISAAPSQTLRSPRKLDDDDRKVLASFFGVDEQVLGGPAHAVLDGMVEIPVLNVEASTGFGAVAASENAQTRFGFDKRWIRSLTSAKSASLSIFGVMGDSMEPSSWEPRAWRLRARPAAARRSQSDRAG
jgi:hypothetical protein